MKMMKTPPVVCLVLIPVMLMFFSGPQIDADHIYTNRPLIS